MPFHMETKLNVFSIFNTVGEYSRVSINAALFQDIAKSNPSLPYTITKDKKGRTISKFVIDGKPVFVRQQEIEGTHTGKDGKEYKNTESYIYMKTVDAQAIQTAKADTQAEYAIDCD